MIGSKTFSALLHFRTPPRVRVRAMVKLSAVFFHDESSITIGGGGEYESAIVPHFQRQKILKKLKKASNISICTNKLLQTCKSWGRPVTSINELDDILRAHGDLAEKIACAELSYTETQN